MARGLRVRLDRLRYLKADLEHAQREGALLKAEYGEGLQIELQRSNRTARLQGH
jgi:hypothetical protein